MSNFKLNIPTDIPWKRKCVSQDMMDRTLCDGKSPLRWRSSIAVFEYEPDEEFQNYDGITISYLKVACTITGYQEDPNEIGLNYRGLKSYWKDQPGIENYVDLLQKYYACYGAILEIKVGPRNQNTILDDYPFFMDFEPKKRELYELATDTKEKQSRSLESLNLTKSAGTTQSLEVMDVDMGGGGFSQQASFAGTGGGFSYSAPNGQWGTKRLNAEESLSSRSADVGQEKRETFSYSTQLSQLYHQLDSYHLGTNRALFFVLPRPHTLETERTFVNGPRNIEGIQEFFLVVARPKGTANVCVEVYLETGHIGKVVKWEMQEVPGTEMKTTWSGEYHARPLGDDNETTVYDEADRYWDVNTSNPGYRIKNATLSSPGARIRYNYDKPNLIDTHPYIADQNADFIKVSGKVHSGFKNRVDADRWEEISYPFTVDITLVKMAVVEKSTDTLFITGRNLCCCDNNRIRRLVDGIVYEKPLKLASSQFSEVSSQQNVPIAMVNQMGTEIKKAILNSRNDLEHRYDNFIKLSQTNFMAQSLVNALTGIQDIQIDHLRNISEPLKAKLSVLNSKVRLTEIVGMPFQMQKDLFSMSEEEVLELRNSLTGLNHQVSDPRQVWLSEEQISQLFKQQDDGEC